MEDRVELAIVAELVTSDDDREVEEAEEDV